MKDFSGNLLKVLLWITGVLVSLAVGFGMTDGVLTVRYLPVQVTAIIGWIIVVTTLLSMILAFFNKKE